MGQSDAQNRLVLRHIQKGEPISHFPVDAWNTLVDGLQNMHVKGGTWDMTEGRDGFRLSIDADSSVIYEPFQVLATEWGDDGVCKISFWFDPDCVSISGKTVNLDGLGYHSGENVYTVSSGDTVWLEITKRSGVEGTLYSALFATSQDIDVRLATVQTFTGTPDKGVSVPVWKIDAKNQRVSNVFRTILFDMISPDGNENLGRYSFDNPNTIYRDPTTNTLSVTGVTNSALNVTVKAVNYNGGIVYTLDEECPCDAFFMRRKAYNDGTEATFVPVALEFEPIKPKYAPFQVLSVDWTGAGCDITYWADPSCVIIDGHTIDLSSAIGSGVCVYHALGDETIYIDINAGGVVPLHTAVQTTDVTVYFGPDPQFMGNSMMSMTVPVWRIDSNQKIVANVFTAVYLDSFTPDGNDTHEPFSSYNPNTINIDIATNKLSVSGVKDVAKTVTFKATKESGKVKLFLDGYSPADAFFMRRKDDFYVNGDEATFVPVILDFEPFEALGADDLPHYPDYDFPNAPEVSGDYIIRFDENGVATYEKGNYWLTGGDSSTNTCESAFIGDLSASNGIFEGAINASSVSVNGRLSAGSFYVYDHVYSPRDINVNGEQITVLALDTSGI